MSPGRRWYTVPQSPRVTICRRPPSVRKPKSPHAPERKPAMEDTRVPTHCQLPLRARGPPRPTPASGLGIDLGITGRLRKDSPEPVHLRTGARCVPADRPPPGTTDSTQHPGVSTTAIVPVGCTRLLAPAEAGPCVAPFKGSQKTSQHYGPYSRSNTH